MAKIAYIRVSTTHQSTDRQQYAMPDGIDKVFEEKVSGKDMNRPELQRMLDYVREGDTVYFESFSRISRSLPDLLNILEQFKEKGVRWVSLKENFFGSADADDATNNLIVAIFGALAAYEREINAERRAYGFEKAKDEGRVGRPKAEVTDEYKHAYQLWKSGKISAVEAIKRSGVGKTTFYKLDKEMQEMLQARNEEAHKKPVETMDEEVTM